MENQFFFPKIRYSKQMKIQVTFDKATKQEFRNQCIKRLQSFVAQMRIEKEYCNQSIKEDSIVHHYEQKPCERYLPIFKDSNNRPKQNRDNKERNSIQISRKGKEVMKYHNTYQNNQRNQGNALMRVKKTPQHQPLQDSIINLAEMKQKVNIILDRLQRTEQIRTNNLTSIQDQLSLTNRKLDSVINYIQQEHSGNRSVNSQIPFSQQFETQFDMLARRYQELKNNSHRSFWKGNNNNYVSLESTRSSMTFRQH